MGTTNIKTIDVQAKEWFDRINGNSYFSAVITINYGMESEQELKVPFQYGSGDHYRYVSRDLLVKSELLKKEMTVRGGSDIIWRYSKIEKCLKREVIAHGL